MKVLFVGLARTLWLFEFRLLNPTGMSLKGVIEEIAKRYDFASAPKNELDFDDQRSLSFKAGTFTGIRRIPVMIGLNVYSDGLVADTTSTTEESSEFLDDLAKWLENTYGLVMPKQRNVVFLSQIDFESEISLAEMNPKLRDFSKSIESRFQGMNKRSLQFEVGAVHFWIEEFGKPGSPAPFKIERKISAPFSANHYFSQAPLSTRQHLELLDDFETLLRARS